MTERFKWIVVAVAVVVGSVLLLLTPSFLCWCWLQTKMSGW
jgi:hypothetical protein